MTFRPELIDELLKEYRRPEDLMGESGILSSNTVFVVVTPTRCATSFRDKP
jgi:putative transposase